MSQTYRLVITGKPMGKQRPRVTKFGSYTPKETVSFENFIKILWIDKYGRIPLPTTVGYKITTYCCFLPSKSTPKKKLELMYNGKILYIKKPDYDNLGKIVGDALNGIAWHDDSQIVDGRTVKMYRNYPAIVLEIEVIDSISPELISYVDRLVELAEKGE